MFTFCFQVKSRTEFDLAIEMQTETKTFTRFATPFVTAKYLSVMQWEEICGNFERIAKNYMRSSPEKDGEFSTEEVTINWKILPKDQSYIRFERLRFTYTLDWILHVKITKVSPLPDRPITPDVIDIIALKKSEPRPSEVVEYEPNIPSSHLSVMKTRYRPSKIETSENNNPPGYSPKCLTSPDYGELSKYTPSKIDNEEVVPSSQSPAKTHNLQELFGSASEDEKKDANSDVIGVCASSSDEKFNGNVRKVVKKRQLFSGEPTDTPHTRKQSTKKMKVDEKQPQVTDWLSTQTQKNKSPSKASQRKTSKGRSTTKNRSESTASNPLQSIDEDKMERMQNFLEKSKQDEMNKDRRRGELENYEIWDCNDVSRDNLRR